VNIILRKGSANTEHCSIMPLNMFVLKIALRSNVRTNLTF